MRCDLRLPLRDLQHNNQYAHFSSQRDSISARGVRFISNRRSLESTAIGRDTSISYRTGDNNK